MQTRGMRISQIQSPEGFKIILDNGLDGITLATSHYEAVALLKARDQLQKLDAYLAQLTNSGDHNAR